MRVYFKIPAHTLVSSSRYASLVHETFNIDKKVPLQDVEEIHIVASHELFARFIIERNQKGIGQNLIKCLHPVEVKDDFRPVIDTINSGGQIFHDAAY